LIDLYLLVCVWLHVHSRYSEESLCVITQDSMTVREIGEILVDFVAY